MNKLLNLIKSEPVMFQSLLQALIGLLMSYGIHMSVEQMGAWLVLTSAVLAFWTRQQVTPHPINEDKK